MKLDDVALLAGVSKGTASRVLNNRGYISQETRKRVLDAMKELNYVPNENARNLQRQRTDMIGVVVPIITYPYYTEIIAHLENYLARHGYKMLLCSTEYNTENLVDYIQTLSKNRVEGALLFNYEISDADYDSMPFPIVSIDRYVRDKYSFVSSNHEQGGQLAADHLIKCGCKHVIQVGGSFKDRTPWNTRHMRFSEVMKRAGIDCVNIEQDYDPHDFHEYHNLAVELLKKYPDTDGFFCNDLFASAVLHAAAELMIPIPGRLNLIGYDGAFISEITTPSITSIQQDVHRIVTSACDILFQMIEEPDTAPVSISIGVKLIKRESTAYSSEIGKS